MHDNQPGTDELVRAYINMRETLESLTAKYEQEASALKGGMELLKQNMLAMCESIGGESIRTPFGTIVRKVDTQYAIMDWDGFYKFIETKGSPALLQKRVHQQNLKEFMQEHPDVTVPGLQVNRSYEITVTKPRKK